MVVCVEGFLHQADVCSVGVGLEFIWYEILVAVHIIHRKGGQLFSAKAFGTNGSNQTGIQSPGQKCTNGYIRNRLSQDCIQYQFPDIGCRIGKIFRMFSIPELPISVNKKFPLSKKCTMTGFKLANVAKYTAARNSSRTKQKNLCRPLDI